VLIGPHISQIGCLQIQVRREHILEDAMHQLQAHMDELRKPLKVTFLGGEQGDIQEEAVDEGLHPLAFSCILMHSLTFSCFLLHSPAFSAPARNRSHGQNVSASAANGLQRGPSQLAPPPFSSTLPLFRCLPSAVRCNSLC
jgi:hypothetical protein